MCVLLDGWDVCLLGDRFFSSTIETMMSLVKGMGASVGGYRATCAAAAAPAAPGSAPGSAGGVMTRAATIGSGGSPPLPHPTAIIGSGGSWL